MFWISRIIYYYVSNCLNIIEFHYSLTLDTFDLHITYTHMHIIITFRKLQKLVKAVVDNLSKLIRVWY